uniref:Uncharacterized protein n=1 Tax=Kalanchoe fedtschenkoi TaxID=63787 RepID=A0A7N0V5P5_KALFE
MGQCVSSVHKDINPDSRNKYHHHHQLLGPGSHGFPLPSPVKDMSLRTVEFSKLDQASRTSSYSYGGKEEAFFDTQPWLDSDCDEDFYSVNGDFTPSRGSTPVHHSFASPQTRCSPYRTSSSALTSPTPGPSPSPDGRKKSLSDLFDESGRYVIEAIMEDNMLCSTNAGGRNDVSLSLPASAVGSPYAARARSSRSGGRTPKGDFVVRKVRSFKSHPSFASLICFQAGASMRGRGRGLCHEHGPCTE